MKYTTKSFRNANEIFKHNQEISTIWEELVEVIENISDDDLIAEFESNNRKSLKSLSEPINKIIKRNLEEKGWASESPIFKDNNYNSKKEKTWRLDFVKDKIALEVAFNHGGNVSWNLIKPVLSSELNHVEKEIQTEVGVIIAATKSLKKYGGFDDAVGAYEKYVEYLMPLRSILTTPIMIIGLEAPETFTIVKSDSNVKGARKYIVKRKEGI